MNLGIDLWFGPTAVMLMSGMLVSYDSGRDVDAILSL